MCPLTTFLLFDFSQIKAHSKLGQRERDEIKMGTGPPLDQVSTPPIDLSLLILTATAGWAPGKEKQKQRKRAVAVKPFRFTTPRTHLPREREREGGPMLMMQNLWRVLLLAGL